MMRTTESLNVSRVITQIIFDNHALADEWMIHFHSTNVHQYKSNIVILILSLHRRDNQHLPLLYGVIKISRLSVCKWVDGRTHLALFLVSVWPWSGCTRRNYAAAICIRSLELTKTTNCAQWSGAGGMTARLLTQYGSQQK